MENDRPMQRVRWVEVVNVSGEEIPPCAVMMVTGIEDDDTDGPLLQVDKPAGDGSAAYLFNGPTPIPAENDQGEDGRGVGTADMPAVAFYDSGDGTPAVGESWGPESGSWQLKKGNYGFRILGNVSTANEIAMVERGTVALWIRFSLNGTLLTTDASISGVDVDDFWNGGAPDIDTVYNMPASSDYVFSGTTGKTGLAVYDEINDKYWIVQMEC